MSTGGNSFKDFVLDQLGDLRDVTCRAMFGGYGLYRNGIFFGIIHDGRLYFKVCKATLPQYQQHGMTPFRPNARQTLTSFYEVPIDVIEDTGRLTNWAEQAAQP